MAGAGQPNPGRGPVSAAAKLSANGSGTEACTGDELRILLVEDVPTDAELEARELRRAGLRIAHRIVDTEEAFRAALRDFQPELIISDFSMPHFDGMWALALARELAPDVPFIFVSGTIGEEYAIRALRNGATDYVLKNNLMRLPAAVERALQDSAERAARRNTERELEETRSRLDSIVSSLPDVVWSVSPSPLRLLYVSRAFEAVWGRPLADLHRNPDVWLEAIHPEDREEVARCWEEALRGGPFDAVYRIARDNGDLRWIYDRAMAIRDQAGTVTRLDGLARDITEIKLQERRIARLSRIHAVLSGINAAIVRIRDRQELFAEACRIAAEHGGFAIAWIGLLDPGTMKITPAAYSGVDAESLVVQGPDTAGIDPEPGQSFAERAIREMRPAFSNDIASEPTRGGERRKEALRRGYRSLIVLPLVVDGAARGILSLFAVERDFFDDEEIKLLTDLADDISFALEHMARQAKLEKLSRLREIMSETNAAIARIHERDALLNETCRIAADHGKFDFVWVGTVNPALEDIRPVAWKGFSHETANAVSWRSITAAGGTLLEAVRTRRAAVRNNIESELPRGGMRREAIERGCRSTVCLPLTADDGVAALIVLFATGQGFFDTDELALLSELAADVSLALQSISRRERLNYLAYYDALTALPNRALFLEHVSHALRAAEHAADQVVLVVSDIKRFRMINDTLGRQAGDAVLKQVTERLLQRHPNPENLARVAADHFATFLPGVKDLAEASHRIEHLLPEALRAPVAVGAQELNLAFATGVAVYPHDGTDAETLFRNAEAALKKAKASDERYLFYQPQMNARVAETLLLETRLRRALEKEQFVLHYQPKIELATGRLSGMEALIRWNDPETGLVPPASFIPILEEIGLIRDVGLWALRRALGDFRAWRNSGLEPPRIAVNVSAVQLARKDFAVEMRAVMHEARIDAQGLDLEITESLLMSDIEDNIAKLRAIRDMGVRIAIDDFGTGYSSLGYLAKLPVNALKIDRSFIVSMANDADSMAIVSTIISLAHALNLKVIAEGVESEEQSKFLRLLRCDEIQGYLFSRPLPAAEIQALLAARRDGV